MTMLLLCGINTSFAQRQKVTDFYSKQTDWGSYSFKGNMTYYCILGEDGKHYKDGTQTITCPQTTYNFHIWPWDYTLSGSYNLTANHAKGKFHGPISSKYKATVRRADGKVINEYESLTGNFTNGIANGTFVVNSKTEEYTAKLNVTYKNGVLVGSYSCYCPDENNLYYKHSGTLSSTGKLIGSWYDGRMLFQNGVLIRETGDGKSTPPAITAKAKQYAAGAITKEALAKEGYRVLERELKLGEYAYTCIQKYAGVDFKALGSYYNFVQETVSYEYLEQICYLNKAGVEAMIFSIVEHGKWDVAHWDTHKKYECIYTDKDGKPYIQIHSNNKQYFSGEPSWSSYYNDVYIKDEDMAYIDAQLAEKVLKKAAPLKSMSLLAKSYIDKDMEQYNNELIRLAQRNGISGNLGEQWKMNKTMKALQDVLNQFKSDRDKKIYVDGVYYYQGYFIIEGSEKELEDAIAELETKKAEIAAAHEAARIAAQQEKERSLIEAKTNAIRESFDFILANRTPTSIAFDENFSRYLFFDKKSEYWKLDVEKILKPFCPVVGCKIVSVTADSAVCHWSVQGKKKVISTYELTLKIYKGRLVIDAETFNINTAKKIE